MSPEIATPKSVLLIVLLVHLQLRVRVVLQLVQLLIQSSLFQQTPGCALRDSLSLLSEHFLAIRGILIVQNLNKGLDIRFNIPKCVEVMLADFVESGIMMSLLTDLRSHQAKVADKLCFLKGSRDGLLNMASELVTSSGTPQTNVASHSPGYAFEEINITRHWVIRVSTASHAPFGGGLTGLFLAPEGLVGYDHVQVLGPVEDSTEDPHEEKAAAAQANIPIQNVEDGSN